MSSTSVRALLWTLAFGSTLMYPNLLGQQPDYVAASPPDHTSRPVGPPKTIDQAPFQAPLGTPSVSKPKMKNGGVNLRQSYDGIDYLAAGFYPPDTNIAVGNNYVVETVNKHMRIFEKRTGTVLQDQPLSGVLGGAFRGDPYAVYDDNADRWYITALDDIDQPLGGGIYLAVSYDGNPVLGFQVFHIPNVSCVSGGGHTFCTAHSDYPKIGFNRDAIFISYADLNRQGRLIITSIDKAAALSGTLTYFNSQRAEGWAMPPAQMHHDVTGGVEWFVSDDKSNGQGDSMVIIKMTDYLSGDQDHTSTAHFEETYVPVTPYRWAPSALQPGGTITTFPNPIITQLQYHDGHLVNAMAASLAADGFTFPKGLYYQIGVDAAGFSKPTLLREGVIDPGPGVAVQMPSVDEDQHGNLGFTWMESSDTEYLSMWVGTLTRNGRFASEAVAQGEGFFYVSDRIGDYSTVVLDPNDKTFWSANEYIGSDGASDIWRTHIASFTAK